MSNRRKRPRPQPSVHALRPRDLPVGYAYEADTHCVPCAVARFGAADAEALASATDAPDGEALEDAEGNPVCPIASWETGEFTPEGRPCGTCGAWVVEPEDLGTIGEAADEWEDAVRRGVAPACGLLSERKDPPRQPAAVLDNGTARALLFLDLTPADLSDVGLHATARAMREAGQPTVAVLWSAESEDEASVTTTYPTRAEAVAAWRQLDRAMFPEAVERHDTATLDLFTGQPHADPLLTLPA